MVSITQAISFEYNGFLIDGNVDIELSAYVPSRIEVDDYPEIEEINNIDVSDVTICDSEGDEIQNVERFKDVIKDYLLLELGDAMLEKVIEEVGLGND